MWCYDVDVRMVVDLIERTRKDVALARKGQHRMQHSKSWNGDWLSGATVDKRRKNPDNDSLATDASDDGR